MHLYDQLLQLQQLDHAFIEWQEYRHDLTRFILRHVRPTSKVAIIGAGQCNDLDLNLLSSSTKSIVLLDKDEEAMRKGIKRYNLEWNKNIAVQSIDLVGISAHMYRAYSDELIRIVRYYGKEVPLGYLTQCAQSFLQQVELLLQRPLELGNDNYDVVIAVGIHSQLLSMAEWLWHIVLETIGKDETTVREQIIALNTTCSKRLNDALFKVAKNTLIIGYEEQRIGRAGTIQGAIQCAEDLNKRQFTDVFRVQEALRLQWPFNLAHRTIYQMHFVALYKESCLY